MLGSRPYRRRRDEIDRRPRWFDLPEDHPEPDEYDPDSYDRFGMMMKIDSFDRAWRDLINEYGFTQVINCMQNTSDPRAASQILGASAPTDRESDHGIYSASRSPQAEKI